MLHKKWYVAVLALKMAIIALFFPYSALAEREKAPVAQEQVQQQAAEIQAEYILSPGDKIRIIVFEDENLSGDYVINDDGIVTVPLIGNVVAAGNTQEQLQKNLWQIFSKGYFVDPHISVGVISLRPFYILGEVKTPGMYEYQPSLNAFKAIAIAGGFTPRARKGSYTIIRDINDKSIELKADDLTRIMPGDAIRVNERFF